MESNSKCASAGLVGSTSLEKPKINISIREVENGFLIEGYIQNKGYQTFVAHTIGDVKENLEKFLII